MAERLRQAAEFADRICADAPSSLAAALAPVGAALVEMADMLTAQVGTQGDVAASRPVTAPEELAALLAHAQELATTMDGASGAVAGLFTAVHDVARAAGADDSGAVTRVVGPLVDRVLRPLAAVVAWAPADGIQGCLPETESIPERLWRLAQAATRLRSDADAPSQLLEATAALQQLAVQLADDNTSRLEELCALQAGLPAGIQVATDGPYLVTNVGVLTNHLGEALPVCPTMALCRCGGSASKPWCDGTHASEGFTGAKDPNRVADQRDRYDGVQVTIFDNRGICQHSGFCTDRLAGVFHVDSQPFVTPSGGRLDQIIRAVRACPSGALSYAIDGQEAREQVDQTTRTPAIEVTKDGPYRITGGPVLTTGAGQPESRAAGASTEHYALCRCGHSQNKPFCSGMHYYINFEDPASPEDTTLFQWAGGLPALRQMTDIFYSIYVPADPLLAPLFAQMSPDHPQRVAAWLGEVFGGPPVYSDTYGGYRRMLSQHVGKTLTEDQRARWVALIRQSAIDAGLPDDAEFQAAFTSYLEWGSRLAVENSQTGAQPPANMPMPRWGWVCNATPGARISALAPPTEQPTPVIPPAPEETVSFVTHIKPLFRTQDRNSMRFAFDLWSYDDVVAHAPAILEQVQAGSMPCDRPWPPEQAEVFARWLHDQTPP